MAKKEVKFQPGKKESFTSIITKSLDKHGRIKGKNKKETKKLKDECFHHIKSKKHKIKPDIQNDGQGTCTCYACNHKFRTHTYSKDDMRDLCDNFMEVVDQAKYITVAANLGRNAEEYLVHLTGAVRTFPKFYTKAVKVVSKEESTKKRKKRKNSNDWRSTDSYQYGSWR